MPSSLCVNFKSTIMNIQKLVLGSFAGGIIKFFLGFLFVGVLLKDFFAQNGGPVTNPDTMVWWALIVGNLFSGVLLVYFFTNSIASEAYPLKKGVSTGFVIGLLVGLGNFLVTYAITLSPDMKAVGVHVFVSAVNYAVAGAFIGWLLGYRKKRL